MKYMHDTGSGSNNVRRCSCGGKVAYTQNRKGFVCEKCKHEFSGDGDYLSLHEYGNKIRSLTR
jgi:hypothetical protein